MTSAAFFSKSGRFKRWTDSIQCCRSHLVGQSGMDLNNYSHGTLSLYAALDVKTGKVQDNTAERHTSREFIAFLSEVVKRTPWATEIHIALHDLSAHETKAVEQFLAEHPKVHFHFTTTCSSWSNQVELWFSKIQRDLVTPKLHVPSAGPTQIPAAESSLILSLGQLTTSSILAPRRLP